MKVASYKNNIWTLDLINALKPLEEKNKVEKFFHTLSVPENEEWKKTRRGISIEGDLVKIWTHAVPLGFTPWDRFPVERGSTIFWFFGPHQRMMDRLMSQGLGEYVWSSFLTASQIEVGLWPKEDRLQERSIQYELHRLGFNPGPLDGIIGPQTKRSLADAGIKEAAPLALQKLQMRKLPSEKPFGKRLGKVIVPGDVTIQTFGDIRTIRTTEGANLDIRGSGRVVLDF